MTGQDLLSLIVGFALAALAWALENWRTVVTIVVAGMVLHALSWLSYQLARLEAGIGAVQSVLISIRDSLGDADLPIVNDLKDGFAEIRADVRRITDDVSDIRDNVGRIEDNLNDIKHNIEEIEGHLSETRHDAGEEPYDSSPAPIASDGRTLLERISDTLDDQRPTPPGSVQQPSEGVSALNPMEDLVERSRNALSAIQNRLHISKPDSDPDS